MKIPKVILAALMLGACSSTPPQPDERPLLRETTLTRYDGSAISVEELASLRASAVSTAETLSRIDRLLLEPWAEQRSARVFLEQLRREFPADTRLAQTLWETAEPQPHGNGRDRFREFGLYANQYLTNGFGPRVRPASLEEYVEAVMRLHSDHDSRSQLLAAWRRFAPVVRERRGGYIASRWEFELDFPGQVSVAVSDSLIGPFDRCAVQCDDVSFIAPPVDFEGYTASGLLIDLLAPGPTCPLAKTVDELHALAVGDTSVLSFSVADGKIEDSGSVDIAFLIAALRGLRAGAAALGPLPQSTRSFTVVLSYLIDEAEARACISFARRTGKWQLQQLEYEPAAARLLGGDARLDLLPSIRALTGRRGPG